MKRFMTAFVPALAAGALLMIGAPSQAQVGSSLLEILPSADAMPLHPGDFANFDVFLTIRGTVGAAVSFNSFQFSVAADPKFFDLSTGVTSFGIAATSPFKTAVPGAGSDKTAAGIPDPYRVVALPFAVASSSATTKANATRYKMGTLSLQVSATAGTGGTNVEIVDTGNFPAVTSNLLLPGLIVKGTNPAVLEAVKTNGFKQTIQVVPGPSALLVFVAGGFAPAMTLLRRRRARAAA